MKQQSDSLLMPLLFGLLVIGVGAAGRVFIDHGAAITANGTRGKLVWILAPALLALMFRRLDWKTRDAHLFALTWRTAVFASLIAALASAATCAVITVGLAAGALAFIPTAVPAGTFFAAAAGIALFAFLEESAWRGYLLPSLLSRARYAVAVTIAALTWFVWHVPYLDQLSAAYTTESLATLAPRLLLGVFAMQILYTEVFLRCRSVWPAVALHATVNIISQMAMLAGLTLTGTNAWLVSPSADGLLLVACFAGVGLWLFRRRNIGARPSKRT